MWRSLLFLFSAYQNVSIMEEELKNQAEKMTFSWCQLAFARSPNNAGKVSMWTLSRCLQRLRCFWQAWWPLNHTGPLWQLLGLLVFTYRCALKGLSGTVRSVHGQLPLFPPSSAHSGSSVPETSKEHRFFLFIRLVVTRSELHCMQGNCTQCALNQAWLIAGTQ